MAKRFDFRLRPGESIRVDPAIGAPVATVEGQRHGAFGEKLIEADEMPLIVGEHEWRHRVSDSRSRGASASELQPRDQPVNRLGKNWACNANGVCESSKTHTEGGVQVTRVLEGLFKNLRKLQVLHTISEWTDARPRMPVQWYRRLH